ncbi:hypothetical protein PRIPAC_81440 [Pristionchus pacificus]|uniref:Uncharacterized protein n=1 Tax=Pristionchus pacificus TaxID=54126 RepID=A0A2A6BHI5_PRIPA|nr:hypothetical protein PRIPAC_81440 [Pristionchus pacificus]|eukprot:PDM65352.1 hypothetical protein PRIPAC_52294 [Pristionchus pacificus]
MHRIGTKQYHRIDNEFLLMYGTYPVSVLVRYPDVFNEKYAPIVLGWFDTSIQHMVHPANYSACHYSPFSVFKLPEDISNSDASTDSNPDPATAITNNFVELGIDWLTTNSYRDAIVETTGDYFDVYPETAMTDSHDTAVESVTTNGYPVTEVEVTRADILDTGSTPDQKSDPIVDGATTLS